MAGAKAYLSPVMDLFNNEIVAFSISRNPNMAQIDEMMGQLASLEFGESPLLHSDSKNVIAGFCLTARCGYPARRDRVAAS